MRRKPWKLTLKKQKPALDFLQNKSPSLSNTVASEAFKKVNDNMKVKIAEVTSLKTNNKQLAEELAEIQNNIHGVGNSSGESDKCAKLTKSCEY